MVPTRRILLDVTRTARSDVHTGIQKVVRDLARTLATVEADVGVSTVLVRLSPDGLYRIDSLRLHPFEVDVSERRALPVNRAVNRIRAILWRHAEGSGLAAGLLMLARLVFATGRKILVWRHQLEASNRLVAIPGDVLLMPDTAWQFDPWPAVDQVRNAKGKIAAIIYDLIPILHPGLFDTETPMRFQNYLDRMLDTADLLIAISETVRNELYDYACARGGRIPEMTYTWPGTDPRTVPSDACPALERMRTRPTVLIVATVEPRKGHADILGACDRLWAQGLDFDLLIVGRLGWRAVHLDRLISGHPQASTRLHWLKDLSDPEVTYAYAHARVAVVPSVAEGYGLPIVEAELLGCPVICSDIPVFREIASPRTNLIKVGDVDAWANAIAVHLGPIPVDRVPPGRLHTSRREHAVSIVEHVRRLGG